MHFFTDKELCDLRNGFEEIKALFGSTKNELAAFTQHNEQLKSMFSYLDLDCKQFSKSKREQNSTLSAMKSTTRHQRRKETEKALTFIHAGMTDSYHWAWDYIVANALKELVDECMTVWQGNERAPSISWSLEAGNSNKISKLVFMIMDFHLRIPHLAKKLVWLNKLENHLIFQFSDDGASETSQMTMSIESLTMWQSPKFGFPISITSCSKMRYKKNCGRNTQMKWPCWRGTSTLCAVNSVQ